MLEYWSIGVLGCWSVGVLECWGDGGGAMDFSREAAIHSLGRSPRNRNKPRPALKARLNVCAPQRVRRVTILIHVSHAPSALDSFIIDS